MPKILLAEDDNDMRRFLVKALQNAGYEVISYDNGLSAYRRLREEPFELLLTDIVMPEMDGIELARRAAELDPDIKIMFITGFAAVALNPDFAHPQGRQGPVEAVPSARPRQRGPEDAGGVGAALPPGGWRQPLLHAKAPNRVRAMEKLSACVITYNDEHTVAWSVSSVQWADEIVVVDTGSTDRTVEIAEPLGARVVRSVPFTGFGEVRNRAAAECRHAWILSLDADERCPPAARDEIKGAASPAGRRTTPIWSPRYNYFMGRLIRGSGWYRDSRTPQLYRQDCMRYLPALSHEGYELTTDKPVGRLDERVPALPVPRSRRGAAQGQRHLLARCAHAVEPARLDVGRARPRHVGVHPALRAQARLHGRLGRLRHCAVEFRRDVLSLRQALRAGAGLATAARSGRVADVLRCQWRCDGGQAKSEYAATGMTRCHSPGPILIVGKRGRVAQDLLAEAARTGLPVRALGRPEIDITDPDTIARAIAADAPRAIVNAAAVGTFEDAERDPDRAFALNRDGAAHLAAAARRAGIPFLHLSSDYVFDGSKRAPYVEDDPRAPLSVYGRSKAEGEQAVLDAYPSALVVRTSWVYGPHGANFLTAMLRLADTQDVVRVVADQYGTPTAGADLARALFHIVARLSDGA